MLIGYARTSTIDQEAGLDAQERDLRALGCEKVFSEKVSSVAPRAALAAALDFMREGDTLVVTKLDRLARSTVHLGEIIDTIRRKRAHLRIEGLGIDTSTATGTLVLNVLGSIAQFEREMMLERQREGIAKAKAEGKYKGRKPTARAMASEVLALRDQGMGATEIATRLGIGRASVYRIMSDPQ
ncbi:recombinase family protein [Thalassobaculum sp. OXR-137]|uniref:recombinase family protein n=1 Tax=Thalassobaculum sp. OXR-137 TaxID=3100173 RepID=UPI002AC8D018|nr:recombinase family protein [Thalassobaculum sp. OXR-137]WPZ32304.1 recombinase family protein [Thalassobaculum sp. OXR-137]